MNIFIITYDLNTPGKDYSHLMREIESLGVWRKPQRSMYIVKTALTTVQISKRLNSKIDGNDYLFFTPIIKNAGGQMDQAFWDWFNSL